MRRFSAILAAISVLAAGVVPAMAQDKDEVLMTVQVIQKEHRQIMADNLELTAKEAPIFWPIYHEYMAEAGKIEAAYAKLVTKFVRHQAAMSNEELTATLHESLRLKKRWLDLREKYFDRVSEAIGVRKAVRFVQVENKLDALVDYKLAQAIPMVWSTPEAAK